MTDQFLIFFFLLMAFLAANTPWVSDRLFVLFSMPAKSGIVRWLEWFVLYVISGSVAMVIEYKMMGTQAAQDWEFYVVTLCLFAVFSLPGFIYYVDLKKILKNR